MSHDKELHKSTVIIRLEAIGFGRIIFETLYAVLMVFTRAGITSTKVNRFGWNLVHYEYILGGWPRQILGGICMVARAGDQAKFCFFLSGKQRTILPIFRRPNFTKFEHNTSIGVAINDIGTEFWKIPRKGTCFAKYVKKWKFLQFCDFQTS